MKPLRCLLGRHDWHYYQIYHASKSARHSSVTFRRECVECRKDTQAIPGELNIRLGRPLGHHELSLFREDKGDPYPLTNTQQQEEFLREEAALVP
jgi:hypothetical protein